MLSSMSAGAASAGVGWPPWNPTGELSAAARAFPPCFPTWTPSGKPSAVPRVVVTPDLSPAETPVNA